MAIKKIKQAMSRSKLRAGVFSIALLAVGIISTGVVPGGPVDAAGRWKVTVDVAEDPSRFAFDGDHLVEEGPLAGLPAYGDGFVTQGWLFAEGTLSEGDPGVECEFGEDGLPTSCVPLYEPIGTWTCYGYHVGEGALTESGYIVVTSQIFDFGPGDGSDQIVTQGMEIVETGEVAYRAITGGTGKYSKARGQQAQTSFGLHPDLFNIRLRSALDTRR